jgi:hypothetical protein
VAAYGKAAINFLWHSLLLFLFFLLSYEGQKGGKVQKILLLGGQFSSSTTGFLFFRRRDDHSTMDATDVVVFEAADRQNWKKIFFGFERVLSLSFFPKRVSMFCIYLLVYSLIDIFI